MKNNILFVSICLLLVSTAALADEDLELNWNEEVLDLLRIQDPCTGRSDSFARDLKSCAHYFYCDEEGVGHRGVCNENNLFHAENELCVLPANRSCFKCPQSGGLSVYSVPNACHQNIQCFNGTARLYVCPDDLVYDGRPHVRQCNFPPKDGGCFREDSKSTEVTDRNVPICPALEDGLPFFLRDDTECNGYWECTGHETPVRRRCPPGLHMDVIFRACRLPEEAFCDLSFLPDESKQPGPAFECTGDREYSVPCRVSCSDYYTCQYNGEAHQNECASNLIFDHRSRSCRKPSEGECWADHLSSDDFQSPLFPPLSIGTRRTGAKRTRALYK